MAWWALGPEIAPGSNVKVCFSGEPTVQRSLALYDTPKVAGEQGADCVNKLGNNDVSVWMSIGGSKGLGIRAGDVSSNADTFLKGWGGLSLDIESADNVSISDVRAALSEAKALGLATHVTVAHTGSGLDATFVKDLLNLEDLDYISPELYTCGKYIQMTPSDGIEWSDWKEAMNDGVGNDNLKVIAAVPSYDFPVNVNKDCVNKWCSEVFGTDCGGVMRWPLSEDADCSEDKHEWIAC